MRFLLLLPLLALGSCFGESKPATPDPKPVQNAAAQPTEEQLLARARARWAAIDKEDWIDAYNFITPEVRKVNPLARYLQGKENHRYDNPVVESIVGRDEKQGTVMLRSRVLWTPQHPQVKQVKLEPGQTLTEEVPIVETWKWNQTDWFFVEQEGADKFFEAHPEYLRASTTEQGK